MKNLDLRVLIKADSRYKFNRKRIKKAVKDKLLEQGVSGEVVLSVLVVGERKIKQLNKEYLGKDGVTDVLSFSQTEGGSAPREAQGDELMLGDVVVCYPQAKKQAIGLNKLLDEEIEFLVLHGVLHLLGIHHD